MILTQCAVCATELGLSLGKKCGRCSTRYCGAECQVQHWKEGGHDTLCKKIKKAGGAEQYNANKKYAEAVAVAVEKCAGRHEGADVLHLHASLALENEGGPRARVLVPRDGGLRARVVSGGAGEDFMRRRLRRTIWEPTWNERWRGGARVACASNNTTALCGARSGGRAGRRIWVGRRTDGLGSMR